MAWTVPWPGMHASVTVTPAQLPMLVITDAWIDRVRIKREHAYLIPAGAVLPFPARGPVFRFS